MHKWSVTCNLITDDDIWFVPRFYVEASTASYALNIVQEVITKGRTFRKAEMMVYCSANNLLEERILTP